jgi:hypothetical protein
MRNNRIQNNREVLTMRKMLCSVLALLCFALLTACGDTAQPQKSGSEIKAVITPKSAALTGDKNIAGILLTIALPAGVTPVLKTDGSGSIDSAATVEIISSSPPDQIMPGATLIPAKSTTLAELTITSIIVSGFKANDSITIHLKVAPGTTPVESDFKLLAFEAYSTVDASGSGSDKIFDMNVTDGSNKITLTPTLTTTIL